MNAKYYGLTNATPGIAPNMLIVYSAVVCLLSREPHRHRYTLENTSSIYSHILVFMSVFINETSARF